MKKEIVANIFAAIIIAFLVYLLTRKSTGGAGGAAGAGGAGGTGEADIGGLPGSGGAGGGFQSMAELAAAVDRLAAGVRVPVFQTEYLLGTSGRATIAAAQTGKALKVLAYIVTTIAGASDDVAFWSGPSKQLWPAKLTPIAGSIGANLATAWPSYLFATNTGESLDIVADAAVNAAVTYWSE